MRSGCSDNLKKEDIAKSTSLSFSGCGFLGIYHVGVATAIKEYAPQLASKVSGASAGAIAGCALVCGVCLGQGTSEVLKVAIQARSRALGPLSPTFNLVKIIRERLRQLLPPDAHKKASGRLFISLTRCSDGKNVLVSEFDSKEELIQAVICSAFIPLYCGTVFPTYRGVQYMDGGWSDNQPSLENCITISPFSGETDICPSDSDSASFFSFDLMRTNVRLTSSNLYRLAVALFPPHPETLSEICRQGFQDAMRFLVKHNLITCTRCVAVQSVITLPDECSPAELMKRRDYALSSMLAGANESSEEIEPFETEPVLPKCLHEHLESEDAVVEAALLNQARADVPSSDDYVKQMVDNGEFGREAGETTKRRRCETCSELFEGAPNKGLPKAVVKSLRDAENLDKNLIGYFLSLRPVTVIRYATIPWVLPFDIAYLTAQKIIELLPSIVSRSCKILTGAVRGARFIVKEIDEHRHKYSARFTCQLAVTELNYATTSSGGVHAIATPGRLRSCISSLSSSLEELDSCVKATSPTSAAASNKAPTRSYKVSRHMSLDKTMLAQRPRFQTRQASSTVSGKRSMQHTPATQQPPLQRQLSAQQPNSAGHCTVTELNFGFTVDLNADSGPVTKLKKIVARDSLEGYTKVSAEDFVHATEAIEWEGLMKAVEGGQTDSHSPLLENNTSDSVSSQKHSVPSIEEPHMFPLRRPYSSTSLGEFSIVSAPGAMTSPNASSLLDIVATASATQTVADVTKQQQQQPLTVSAATVTGAPAAAAPISWSSSSNLVNDDVDAFASILEFTRHHEALMAFYYRDERTNKVKVTEIFGLGDTFEDFGGLPKTPAADETEEIGGGVPLMHTPLQRSASMSRHSMRRKTANKSLPPSRRMSAFCYPSQCPEQDPILSMEEPMCSPVQLNSSSTPKSTTGGRYEQDSGLGYTNNTTADDSLSLQNVVQRKRKDADTSLKLPMPPQQPTNAAGEVESHSESGSDAELFVPRRNKSRKPSIDGSAYDGELSSD